MKVEKKAYFLWTTQYK